MTAPAETVTRRRLSIELPDRDLPVTAKLRTGILMMLREHKADATAADGREIEIDATMTGAPIITVRRLAEPPEAAFVAIFSLEALVAAALDAEEAHHAATQTAAAAAMDGAP